MTYDITSDIISDMTYNITSAMKSDIWNDM